LGFVFIQKTVLPTGRTLVHIYVVLKLRQSIPWSLLVASSSSFLQRFRCGVALASPEFMWVLFISTLLLWKAAALGCGSTPTLRFFSRAQEEGT